MAEIREEDENPYHSVSKEQEREQISLDGDSYGKMSYIEKPRNSQYSRHYNQEDVCFSIFSTTEVLSPKA